MPSDSKPTERAKTGACPSGKCERCACELSKGDEYCPCCGDINPGFAPSRGRRPAAPIHDEPTLDYTPIYGGAIEPMRFSGNDSIKVADIPHGIGLIGYCAFQYCESLWKVTLPEGLKRIGSQAFAGCGAREIVIPESVVYIGEGAFRGCKSLEYALVRCPKSVVPSDAFDGCINLREINYANED